MDRLESVVDKRTRMGYGYREHASIQSIDTYLDDWQAAYLLLDRRILGLQLLRDERAKQIENGEWPPKPDPAEVAEAVRRRTALDENGNPYR